MKPGPPDYIKFTRQNTQSSDCVVATLAMMFAIPYEESLAACVSVNPEVLEEGMTWPDIKDTAEDLGGEVRLVRRGRYDINTATGLLNVKRTGEDHIVLLWEGRIIEGNGEFWRHPSQYLRHYKYKPYSLMVITKNGQA